MRGFADELAKLAAGPANQRPASSADANAIPVQRIPSGPSPVPQQPVRPALPSAPAYQPPQTSPAAPQKTGGGAAKPVGSAWLQMADRRPTEFTSAFVSRQYGVPERQMGVNKGLAVADARDSTRPAQMRTLWATTPVNEGYASAVHVPKATDTSKMNVPSYLQRAVGGINNSPQPYIMQNGRAQPFGTVGAGGAPLVLKQQPSSAATTQQPAQAAI
jgi:hypothetical protein